jgi:hypothetical protein
MLEFSVYNYQDGGYSVELSDIDSNLLVWEKGFDRQDVVVTAIEKAIDRFPELTKEIIEALYKEMEG